MIAPLQRDDLLRADILAAREEDSLHLWWLGQSGFLVKWNGTYAAIDPYLSDSLTRKYAGSGREHARMTALCLSPEALGLVDVVLCSHLHGDHFDADTLEPIGRRAAERGVRLKLVLPRAIAAVARSRLGEAPIDLIAIDAGEELAAGRFRVKAVPAAHPTVERDASGQCRFLGYVLRAGRWNVYHSGDTVFHDGLIPSLQGEFPDVALLPINGNDPARGVPGNLNGQEAAELARACGARCAIPHHFDMFAFNTASPGEFVSACERLGQEHRVLRCGERWSAPRPS